MPRFAKILLKDVPETKTSVQWRLIIDNPEDLKRYHSLDATLNMEAFMSMERENGKLRLSHVGAPPTRSLSLLRLINTKVDCTPKGEKIYPIIEVANITDRKYLGMLKCIGIHGVIQINSAGGYCDLKSFLKTWDGEILEYLDKNDWGFPIDDEIIIADTIILENSHPDYAGSYMNSWAQKEIPNSGSVKTIYNLREIDHAYIFKCLHQCRNVAISTQLRDLGQLDSFMGLFQKLPRKNIYLCVGKETKSIIQAHSLWNANNELHNIIFKPF